MAWLPGFGDVVARAAVIDSAALPDDDPAPLLAGFPGGVRIDDPRTGTIDGEAAARAFFRTGATWLAERDARCRPVAVTVDRTRAVGEFDLELTEGDRTFILPVAVVAEPDPARRALWVRIYHSQWPLLGRHVVRPPLLTRDPDARESDVVGEYQAALAAGDAERITATFEPNGCFREPAGPQFRRCGVAVLREFFARFFSAGGGIVLEHCTATEDGVRTALEFNAVRWGGVDLPPQAGIAVYERGPSGRLAHARIYDDVQGPVA
jgi:hypothetical protein